MAGWIFPTPHYHLWLPLPIHKHAPFGVVAFGLSYLLWQLLYLDVAPHHILTSLDIPWQNTSLLTSHYNLYRCASWRLLGWTFTFLCHLCGQFHTPHALPYTCT